MNISEYIQPYDAIMLAVLAVCVGFGVWKGMAWQVAALASVFASGAAAIALNASVAPYLTMHFNVHDPWNRILAMLGIYMATSLAIWLVFRLVKRVIDNVHLKEFDRQLGALFGLLKGAIYCVVITFFAVTLSEWARGEILISRSGHFIARTIREANPVLPEEVRAVLGKYIDELDEKLHAPPPEASPEANVASPGEQQGQGENTPSTTSAATKSGDLGHRLLESIDIK
jgi:membrane protein required for colicin V production